MSGKSFRSRSEPSAPSSRIERSRRGLRIRVGSGALALLLSLPILAFADPAPHSRWAWTALGNDIGSRGFSLLDVDGDGRAEVILGARGAGEELGALGPEALGVTREDVGGAGIGLAGDVRELRADQDAVSGGGHGDAGAELIVFPELSLNGYPPRDLVEKPSFIDQTQDALRRLAIETTHMTIAIVCGYVGASEERSGKRAVNAACVLSRGQVIFRQQKMLLPTYDVFDEARYFESADHQQLWTWKGRRIALTICEDAWNDKQYWSRQLYERDPVEELAAQGAEILISINASPYHMGKRGLRREIFATTARTRKIPVVYVNQVGGNDQLVFDGTSFALNAQGEPIAEAPSFREDIVIVDVNKAPSSAALRARDRKSVV